MRFSLSKIVFFVSLIAFEAFGSSSIAVFTCLNGVEVTVKQESKTAARLVFPNKSVMTKCDCDKEYLRFEDDTMTFWRNGDSALLLRRGERSSACSLNSTLTKKLHDITNDQKRAAEKKEKELLQAIARETEEKAKREAAIQAEIKRRVAEEIQRKEKELAKKEKQQRQEARRLAEEAQRIDAKRREREQEAIAKRNATMVKPENAVVSKVQTPTIKHKNLRLKKPIISDTMSPIQAAKEIMLVNVEAVENDSQGNVSSASSGKPKFSSHDAGRRSNASQASSSSVASRDYLKGADWWSFSKKFRWEIVIHGNKLTLIYPKTKKTTTFLNVMVMENRRTHHTIIKGKRKSRSIRLDLKTTSCKDVKGNKHPLSATLVLGGKQYSAGCGIKLR